MSYTIVRTDGSVLTVIPDGVVNTSSTPLSLPGRNYSSYGVVVDTNFVHQLENFADDTLPANAIRGQLYYSTAVSTQGLYICPTDGEDELNNWIKILTNNDTDLTLDNLDITGNITANNAHIANDLNANHVIANYLTVNVSGNLLNANVTGNANIANLKTSNLTTGSSATAGTMTGNWTVSGNVNVSSGIVSAGNVKTDNYQYANGVAVAFSKPAGSNTQVQYNNNGNLGATGSLTFDTDLGILNIVGSANAVDFNASGVFRGPASELTNVPASNLQGTISTSVQSNITQVGTLGALTVSGAVNSATLSASGNVSGARLIGSLVTAAQPNITSVGTLNGLTVTGNVSASGLVIGNGSSLSSITGANVTGTVANATYAVSAGSAASATISGTVTTAAQPNITSVGTLTSLIVSGNITGGNVNSSFSGDGSRIFGINASNVVGIVANATYASSAGLLTSVPPVANTVSNSAQPNITSLGILNSLTVTGNINVSSGRFIGDGYTINNLNGANVVNKVANAVYADVAGVSGPSDTANTVVFNAQPNITSVGTLTSLVVSGNVNAANFVGKFFGNGAGLTNIPAASIVGTVSSASSASTAGTVTNGSQPNITSVGTLSSLSVSGSVTATGVYSSFYGNGAGLSSLTGGNVIGAVANATYAATAGSTGTALTAGSAAVAGTVTGNAQSNITSVGTLTSLAVSGSMTQGGSNVVTESDFTKGGSSTGWTRLPNGMLLQYGMSYVTTEASTRIYYPIAFSSYSVAVGSGSNQSSADGRQAGPGVTYCAPTYFDVYSGRYESGPGSYAFFWHAIGY